MTTEKFEVRNRWTDVVQFTAEISVTPNMLPSIKLGLAIKLAIKNSADLSGADLRDANLSGANLRCADLSCADLSGANLRDAYLSGAKDADCAIAQTRILPEGDLIGWKKCKNDVMVRLRIPEDAPRSHAFGRKCRAKFADVLEVVGGDVGISSHDGETIYRMGERVEAPNWSDDWQTECAGGIHFFITRIEAENY